MDMIFEILLEIILEGMLSGAASKKVPLILRILLAFALLAFFGGVVALIFYVAICNQNIVLGLVGIGMLILLTAGAVKKIRRRGGNGTEKER